MPVGSVTACPGRELAFSMLSMSSRRWPALGPLRVTRAAVPLPNSALFSHGGDREAVRQHRPVHR
jgi:hypothetical protein